MQLLVSTACRGLGLRLRHESFMSNAVGVSRLGLFRGSVVSSREFIVSASTPGKARLEWDEAADLYFKDSKEIEEKPVQKDSFSEENDIRDYRERPEASSEWNENNAARGRPRSVRTTTVEDDEDVGRFIRRIPKSKSSTLRRDGRTVNIRQDFEGSRGNYMRKYDQMDDELQEDQRYRTAARSDIPTLQGGAVYGIGPVKAVLQARRREAYTLYIQERLGEKKLGRRKSDQDIKWIQSTAKELEIEIKTVSKHVLNMLVDNRPHQGLVLDASDLELVQVYSLDRPTFEGKAPVWVALDEVQDPQNFGSILRSSYYFGADGVVVCTKNSAPLSGVVSKASAGALEVMELLSCHNMMKFLANCVDNGWRVVGSAVSRDAVPLEKLPKNIPTILVLGNEGTGMRTNVIRACTDIVRIGGQHHAASASADEDEEEEEGEEEEEEDEAEGGEEREESGDSLSLHWKNEELKEEVMEYMKKKKNVGSVSVSGGEVECLVGPPVVESLNVGVAAGVLLHEFLRS